MNLQELIKEKEEELETEGNILIHSEIDSEKFRLFPCDRDEGTVTVNYKQTPTRFQWKTKLSGEIEIIEVSFAN